MAAENAVKSLISRMLNIPFLIFSWAFATFCLTALFSKYLSGLDICATSLLKYIPLFYRCKAISLLREFIHTFKRSLYLVAVW